MIQRRVMADPPLDNAHCFKGMGLAYWRDMACGLQPTGTQAGPQGHQVTYAKDPNDGFAMQNGGLSHPEMSLLHGRPIIRFMHAGTPTPHGLAANWWLDIDAYPVLSHYALNQKITLASAAQTLLVVPREWSDCGQMIVARPKVVLMGYRGKGRPVALLNGRDTSPDAQRLPGTRLYGAPQGTSLEQIFLPGERRFLASWLTLISSHRADAGGGAIPPL